ncbi:hypothetical protein MRX96_009415 [Rhipicephalus microplus]
MDAEDLWVPSGYARICSKHFTKEDYAQGPKKRYFMLHATPTLFLEVCDNQKPGRRGQPRKQLRVKNQSSIVAVDELASEPPSKRASGAARKRVATKSHRDEDSSEPSPVVGRTAVHSKGDSTSHHPIQSMPPSIVCCAIPGCGSLAGITSDVVLHEFPSKSERRQLWTQIVRALRPPCRDPADLWVPSEYARICSKHFTKDEYIQGPRKRYLAPHATPTLFLEACGNQKPWSPRSAQEATASRRSLLRSTASHRARWSLGRGLLQVRLQRPWSYVTCWGDNSHSKRDHQEGSRRHLDTNFECGFMQIC